MRRWQRDALLAEAAEAQAHAAHPTAEQTETRRRIVAAFGDVMSDTHEHVCQRCGATWTHDRYVNDPDGGDCGSRRYTATCPHCAEKGWWS